VVFLAVHPSTYRTAGLRWGTATSSSTRPGTTSSAQAGAIRGIQLDIHSEVVLVADQRDFFAETLR
jgi:hypothetical protein